MGANLTNKKFARDLDSVIQRAQDAGVSKIMVTGTSVKSSKDALRLSQLYPGIQSFSALKKFDCARAQSENLRKNERKIERRSKALSASVSARS